MPLLFFNNVEKETVKELSEELVGPLAEAIGCPEDWFSFTHTASVMFYQKKVMEKTAYVEVKWFQREQKIQDAVAKIINGAMETKRKSDVIITFTKLEEEKYYEAGEHF